MTWKWLTTVSTFAFASLFIVAGSRADPIIVNAGFETPELGTGSYLYHPSGAGVGWDFSAGGSGITSNSSGFTFGNPDAPEGTQVAFLQLDGFFSQTISGFTAGRYSVEFFAAQRAAGGGTEPSTQDFSVSLDNVQIGLFLPTTTSYLEYSTKAVFVTAGSHTLTFTGLNSSHAYDVTAFIDDVQIQASAVPEPSSFIMLGIGATAVLIYVRRRLTGQLRPPSSSEIGPCHLGRLPVPVFPQIRT